MLDKLHKTTCTLLTNHLHATPNMIRIEIVILIDTHTGTIHTIRSTNTREKPRKNMNIQCFLECMYVVDKFIMKMNANHVIFVANKIYSTFEIVAPDNGCRFTNSSLMDKQVPRCSIKHDSALVFQRTVLCRSLKVPSPLSIM